MFFYSDTNEAGGKNAAGYERWDATKKYLEHHANMLMLDFFAKNERDPKDRAQARHEMELCQRKLNWWKNHPNYNQHAVTRGIERQKREWKGGK